MSELDELFQRLREIREELEQRTDLGDERRRLLHAERDRLHEIAAGWTDETARLRREIAGVRAELRDAERRRLNVSAMRSGNSGLGQEDRTLPALGRAVDAGLGVGALRDRLRRLEARLAEAEVDETSP